MQQREREKNVSFKTTLPHRRCSIFTPRALFHYRDAEVYTEQRHLIRAQSVLQIDCFSTCQRARAAERTSYRLRNVYRQRKYIYIYIYHPQFARAQYTTIWNSRRSGWPGAVCVRVCASVAGYLLVGGRARWRETNWRGRITYGESRECGCRALGIRTRQRLFNTVYNSELRRGLASFALFRSRILVIFCIQCTVYSISGEVSGVASSRTWPRRHTVMFDI